MSDVLISDEGAIRTVRMNRSDKKNALTLAMYDAMAAALEDANGEAGLRCLRIAGAPDVFCAGNDIGDFLKFAQGGGLGAPILRFLHALVRCDKPLLAAVNGNAVGIGTTMLLHCDYVVAGDDARFATPFVSLGLVPEAASSLVAPRLMGHARAFSLLVMGERLDAKAAQAAGLVNKVVAAADVEAQSMAAAQTIAALPPQAVAISRRLMRGEVDEIVARIAVEAEEFKGRLASPEAQAAFAAFMTRKK